MKRILATTALTASLCMPAFAQDATTTEAPEAGTEMHAEAGFLQSANPQDVMASDFIGKRVYAMAEQGEYGEEGLEEADAAWDDIGEVSDVILTRAGEIEGVIVDVGGFLGIGEKPVALSMDSLKLVSDSNSPGDYFVTIALTREEIDQAPAFEFNEPAETMEQTDAGEVTPLEETPGEELDMAETTDPVMKETDDAMTADVVETEDTMEATGDEAQQDMAEAGDSVEAGAEDATEEMAEAGDNAADATGEVVLPETDMAETDATDETVEGDVAATEMADGSDLAPMEGFTREGYSEVMITEISSEDLTGLAVYDSEDNRVGEISEVLISSDGVVSDAVIDVGGFLGIGEKPVAISFKGISLQQQSEGDDLRAYVNTTEEQLKSFPEYEGG